MQITNITLTIVEMDGPAQIPLLVPVPAVGRIRYVRQGSIPASGPCYERFLRVFTDSGIEGVCTASTPEFTPQLLEMLKAQVLGADPLCREALYQRLHLGTRLLHVPTGWFGNFDNCLWDIAGKVARLPVCRLLGQVRDAVPVYHTGSDGDSTAETYLRLFDHARESWGVTAYKFHNFHGAAANIRLFRALRHAAGDGYTLINDPVCSYSLSEAIQLGRAMEELGFLWLEEPLYEQELHDYQRLCAALETMPVLATETLMPDVRFCAQWLRQGGTDLVRANARNGTTALMKLAHMAELHGTSIELNGDGGLAGHVHANLQCAIPNTWGFEHFGTHVEAGKACGIVNPPEVQGGHLRPSMLPGWGAELDWAYIRMRTVAEY